jgi:hypothetical protein
VTEDFRPIYGFPPRKASEATPSLTPEQVALREFQPARFRREQKEAGEREYAQSARGQKFIRETLEAHEDAVYERRRLERAHGGDLAPLPGELNDAQLAEITRLVAFAYTPDEPGIDMRPERTLADVRAEADALELTGKRQDLLASAQRAVARLEEATEGEE